MSIVFLAREIAGVGQRVHSVGAIRLVNFSFKIGRNYDELARSLISYKDCATAEYNITFDQRAAGSSSANYKEKFDIVWSGFTHAYGNVDKYWSGTGYWLDESRAVGAARLRNGGLEFLRKYQSDMASGTTINCVRINEMLNDIYLQKEAISEFAQGYYELDQRTAREQQMGVKNQYNIILLLAVSFIATLLLTAALAYKAVREASLSNQKSQVAGRQAIVALSQLRESASANAAQNKYFAAASHDLRQPLHALGLYLGSLNKHVDTAEALHILHCANLSTESLSGLLDSLLDIAKLDAGVVSSNKSEVGLSALLVRIHSRFLPEAQEKNLELRFKSVNSWVYTDEVLLDRIIQNLLSNALSYTDEGHIEIASAIENDHVVITISDTGSGIPELQQEAVYTEFYQLHNKRRDRGKGLGLGLSIVRKLSDILEIDVEMQSIEGKGTTFILRLPVIEKPNSSGTAPTQEVVPVSVGQSAPTEADLRGVKILLIEDEEDIRDSTMLVLKARGSTVRAAENIKTALQICTSEHYLPDVILADYRLGNQETGLQAIERLRNALGATMPAIIITGDMSVEFQPHTELTHLEVLYKPVGTKTLVSHIAKMVSKKLQS